MMRIKTKTMGHAGKRTDVKKDCMVKSCGNIIAKTLKKSAVIIEENNNDIDNIATQISKMGNLTNKFSAGDLLCCEIRDSDQIKSKGDYEQREKSDSETEQNVDEDKYKFDEFDEEESDEEHKLETVREVPYTAVLEDSQKIKLKFDPSVEMEHLRHQCRIHTFNRVETVRGPQRQARANMSFTNDKLRDIERENDRLLHSLTDKKLNAKSGIPSNLSTMPPRKVTSSSIRRKREEQRIQRENLILLRKLQTVKPECPVYRRRIPQDCSNCSCHSNSNL